MQKMKKVEKTCCHLLKHLVRYLLRCGEYQKRKRIRNKKMKKVVDKHKRL